MNLDQHFNDIKTAQAKLKAEITAFFNNLPDNPDIARSKEVPNVFTISSKNLGESWSPFYHDHRAQYDMICDLALNAIDDGGISRLKDVLTGRMGRYTFAKVVIDNCRDVLIKIIEFKS
jgi:hypothetical protein